MKHTLTLLSSVLLLLITNSIAYGLNDESGSHKNESEIHGITFHRKPSLIQYTPYQENESDTLYQDIGTIFFNGSNDPCGQDSRSIAEQIHHICYRASLNCTIHHPHHDKTIISQAEYLLKKLSSENIKTPEEKLHRCIAVVRIGEAHLADPDTRDKAYDYFIEAVETHNFTGVMPALALLSHFKNKHVTGLYWIMRASQNGMLTTPRQVEFLREKCNQNPEEKQALEAWEEACEHKGLHHPEEDRLPSIHNVD